MKYQKIKEIQRKQRINLFGTMMMFLLSFGLIYQIYMEENYAIYDTTLRFHVRADSDSRTEQEQKLAVRDAVLADIKSVVDQAENAKQLGAELAGHLQEMTQIADHVLRENGSENRVSVYLTKERFPLRVYGGVVFPAGEYNALRVDIGKAEGHNWWCALYPELCYGAEDAPVLSAEGESDLEEAVPAKERNVISGGKIRFRFKILEWFSRLC